MVHVDKSIEKKGRKIMVTEPLKMTLLLRRDEEYSTASSESSEF